MSKRSRLKRPLLRRYGVPIDSADTNPHHTFRRHEKDRRQTRARTRKNDQELYFRMQQASQDLGSAKALLDVVGKRERIKRDLEIIAEDLFLTRVDELAVRS